MVADFMCEQIYHFLNPDDSHNVKDFLRCYLIFKGFLFQLFQLYMYDYWRRSVCLNNLDRLSMKKEQILQIINYCEFKTELFIAKW